MVAVLDEIGGIMSDRQALMDWAKTGTKRHPPYQNSAPMNHPLRAAEPPGKPASFHGRDVLIRLCRAGECGLTDQELLPMEPTASSYLIRLRLRELVAKGLIRDSGRRRQQPGQVIAKVWVRVDDG